MSESKLAARVDAIRRFNRVYTGRIGLLTNHHLGTRWSLTEARILYELGQKDGATAKFLCETLGLDQGYVSRLLARFEKDGLILRRTDPADKRVQHIALTKAGHKTHAILDIKAGEAITALIKDKVEADQCDLVEAAQCLTRILGSSPAGPVVIRVPRAGDIGWIVHRHGTVIATEFGWDQRFEAVIAGILGTFGHHPGREAGFIAERDGRILGSIFVMPEKGTTARLRVLYVEPAARGLGLGKKLVDLAVSFARETGYRKLVLWTHEFQVPARKIYLQAGFTLTAREETSSFGMPVISETWTLSL